MPRCSVRCRTRIPTGLVRIYTDAPPFKFRFSVADYLAFTEQQTRFERHATYTDRSVTFSNGEVAELLRARVVSWQFFSVLGVSRARPRFQRDGRPRRRAAVALASQTFWQQRLGGRSDAIGKAVRLDGDDVTIVGVLPPAAGPLERRQDLFLIQQFTPPTRKGPFFYSVVARLPEGADRGLAAGELRGINRALFPIWKTSYQDEKATWSMEDLKTNLVGDVRAIAGVSLGAVALVWLIACANASNLLIARVAGRRQELAVRAALGASRGRVIRYLLVESGLLAAGAAMVAIAVTYGGMQMLQTLGASYFPRTGEIQFDGNLGWLMLALAISSALLFGLIPAFNVTGGSVDESLRSSRSATAGVGVRRMRRGLVAAQFAIATPLLVAAGLLLASLNALKSVDLGVDGDRILSASVRLPGAQYREERENRRLLGRARAAPGKPTGHRRCRVRRRPSADHGRTAQQLRPGTVSGRRRRIPAGDGLGRDLSRLHERDGHAADRGPAARSSATSTPSSRRRTCCRSSSIRRGRNGSSRTSRRSASDSSPADAATASGQPSLGSSAT